MLSPTPLQKNQNAPMLISTSLVLALAAGAHAAPPQSRPASDRPDVLVIVIDDAGFEDYVLAPADDIAALAAFGRVYTQFYTTPVCSPSRYQLHFGRYSHDRLIGSALSPFSDVGAPTEDDSIAEHLGVAGYRTALFGKWHLSGKQEPIQIFEAPRVHGYQTWRAGSVGNIADNGDHYDWERIDDGQRTDETRYTTLAIAEELEQWWQTTDGPRFAVCSFLAPHEPFQLPPPELVPDVPTSVGSVRERFDWAMQGVDNAVGRLATSLDLSNAFVFLLPDNGTPHNAPPLNPNSPGYKLSPYQGGIRVPLVVWGPGVVPGMDGSLTQIVDLPATILELTGSDPMRDNPHSISFAATVRGGAGERGAVWSQRFKPNGGPFKLLDLQSWAVVRADGKKLLVDDQPFSVPGSITTELYDLNADPWEQQPLEDPAVEAELDQLRIEFLGPDWPYPY